MVIFLHSASRFGGEIFDEIGAAPSCQGGSDRNEAEDIWRRKLTGQLLGLVVASLKVHPSQSHGLGLVGLSGLAWLALRAQPNRPQGFALSSLSPSPGGLRFPFGIGLVPSSVILGKPGL